MIEANSSNTAATVARNGAGSAGSVCARVVSVSVRSNSAETAWLRASSASAADDSSNRTSEWLADEYYVSRGLSCLRLDLFAGSAGLRIQVKIRRPHQPPGHVLRFL
jgi:hypothetical protein